MLIFAFFQQGDCDYFTHADQEFFVTAKMCHFWCVPMCPDSSDCMLRSKSWQNRGLDVADVPGIAGITVSLSQFKC